MTETEILSAIKKSIDELCKKFDALRDSHASVDKDVAVIGAAVDELKRQKNMLWEKYDKLEKNLNGIGWKLALALIGAGGVGGGVSIFLK